MASSSNRRFGSSGRSNPRRRVVIGAHETLRVHYDAEKPKVESERAARGRGGSARARRAIAQGVALDATRRRETTLGHGKAGATPRSAQGRRLANAKREERERRRRLLRIRRSIVSALMVGALAVSVWAVSALARSEIFRLERIVVSGTRHLTADEVRALAQVPDGSTLFTISTRRIERAVATSPWVEEVAASREFPHGLRVNVTERVPVIVVDAGGKDLWVVSRDGRWLGERSAVESGVPVVRDVERPVARPGRRVEAPEILNAASLASALSDEMLAQTAYISAPSIERTAIVTKDEVEVFFGQARDVATKERIALEILRREKGRVVYVNVRVVESPTWRGIGE